VQAQHEGAAPRFEDREIQPVGADRPLADVVQGRGRGVVRHGYTIVIITIGIMLIIQHRRKKSAMPDSAIQARISAGMAMPGGTVTGPIVRTSLNPADEI
jgi:hypothetical protein